MKITPLGLKPPDSHRAADDAGRVGIFPILSDTGQEMVLARALVTLAKVDDY